MELAINGEPWSIAYSFIPVNFSMLPYHEKTVKTSMGNTSVLIQQISTHKINSGSIYSIYIPAHRFLVCTLESDMSVSSLHNSGPSRMSLIMTDATFMLEWFSAVYPHSPYNVFCLASLLMRLAGHVYHLLKVKFIFRVGWASFI